MKSAKTTTTTPEMRALVAKLHAAATALFNAALNNAMQA
jgi:hypothetical protein